MGIFGRKTARRRLRRAAQQSLTIPPFNTPVDVAPWVIGDLWPAELSEANAQTGLLARYLSADLQRIVDSANEKLDLVRQADVVDLVKLAERARIINVARAFAVLRVESTRRLLRSEALEFQSDYLSMNVADTVDRTCYGESDITQDLPPETPPDDSPDSSLAGGTRGRHAAPEGDGADAVPAAEPAASVQQQSDRERLQHLVEFVARQEPGLRWAVGDREDGTTVVVTDIAHGWIPPGIDLPGGVKLLPPARREGTATALLGQTTASAVYTPGDPFSVATEFDAAVPSLQPRELPAVADLGWELGEATNWRDDLSRMVHTLAEAGAAGTGAVDVGVDVLWAQLDTAHDELLAQYPDIDMARFLNCLLLAAAAGIATGDRVSANYHAAWFLLLNAP